MPQPATSWAHQPTPRCHGADPFPGTRPDRDDIWPEVLFAYTQADMFGQIITEAITVASAFWRRRHSSAPDIGFSGAHRPSPGPDDAR